VKIIAISGGGRIGPRGYLHMAGVLGAAPCLLQAFRLEENVKRRPGAYRRGERMQVDLNRESECIPRLDLLALPGSSKMFGG